MHHTPTGLTVQLAPRSSGGGARAVHQIFGYPPYHRQEESSSSKQHDSSTEGVFARPGSLQRDSAKQLRIHLPLSNGDASVHLRSSVRSCHNISFLSLHNHIAILAHAIRGRASIRMCKQAPGRAVALVRLAPHERVDRVLLTGRHVLGHLHNGGNVLGARPAAASQGIHQTLLCKWPHLCTKTEDQNAITKG